jgi:hypothetical protein
MARKRASADRQPRRQPKPKGGSGWKRFFHFIWLAPVRRLILTIIFLGLIIWHWTTISNWVGSVWEGTLDLFGWGLLFLVLALGFIIGVVWGRRVLAVIYHWNQWLGGVAFIFTAWGIVDYRRRWSQRGLPAHRSGAPGHYPGRPRLLLAAG